MVTYVFLGDNKKYDYTESLGANGSQTSVTPKHIFPKFATGFSMNLYEVEASTTAHKLHRINKKTGKSEVANVYMLNSLTNKTLVSCWKPE